VTQIMPHNGITAPGLLIVLGSSIVAAVVGVVPALSEAAWTNAPLIITALTASIAGWGVFVGKRSEAISKKNADSIERLRAAAEIRATERTSQIELANARAAESAAKIAELHALASVVAVKVDAVQVVSRENAENIAKIEVATNSMKDALVAKTEAEALERGNREGKITGAAEEVARQDLKKGL
jgi:hypothetical protein